MFSVQYEFYREGKDYSDTSCVDAPIPPPLPIPRCNNGEEAVVNPSRHLMTAARAYYCMILAFCINGIGADFFSGSMALRCTIKVSFFSRMIVASLLRT
jgi:hypothetical protein